MSAKEALLPSVHTACTNLVTVLRAGQLVTVEAQDVMVTRSVEKMVLSAATTARREAAMREKRILRDLFVGSGKGGI